MKEKIFLFAFLVFFSVPRYLSASQYLYVGSGTEGLLTLDYSDLSSPNITSSFPVEGEIQTIERSDDFLLVSAGLGGVYLFKLFNPAQPQLVASYNTLGFAMDAVKFRNYIFVADFEGGVKIFKLVDNKLEKIGKIKTIGMVLKVILKYPYLIIANENNGVIVYDISNVRSPVTVNEIDTPGIAWDIVEGSDNKIIVSLKDNGFAIYDFSKPPKMEIVSKVKTKGVVNKLYYYNNKVYVIESSERINDNPEQYKGFEIFDISAPDEPKLLKNMEKILVRDLIIKDGKLFLALGRFGIKVLDLKTLTDVSSFNIGTKATGVWCNNKEAVVADDTGGIKFLNITQPDKAKIVKSISSIKPVSHVCGLGNTVYIADPDKGVLIYNVSDPSNPVRKGFVRGKGAVSVKCDNKYLYVLIENYGIKIYELVSKTSPALIARIGSGGEQIFDIAAGGGRLLSSQGWNGVSMINISNINRPYPAGHMKALAENTGITARGNYFFVTRINAGLMIGSDLEDYNLFEVSHVNIKAKCHNVSLKDNLAYVASDTMGMVIADISDIKKPYQIGKLDTDGEVYDIHVNSNNMACIADGWNGLVLSDVKDPSIPKKVKDVLWFVPTALGK